MAALKNGSVSVRYRQERAQVATGQNARRSSLAQILFGSSPVSGKYSPKRANSPSSTLLNKRKSMAAQSIPNLYESRNRLTLVPPDSRVKHHFDSDGLADEELNFSDKRPSLFSVNECDYATIRRKQSQAQTVRGSRSPSLIPTMPRSMRIVVIGAKKVGKTAILRQLSYYEDITERPYLPTIEDTYRLQTQSDGKGGPKEIVTFHDTAGVEGENAEIRRQYLSVADAFLLVYSIDDMHSFRCVQHLKTNIDKQLSKDKKDIVVVGTMTDLPFRKVDGQMAQQWASNERVKLYEVSVTDRNSLVEFLYDIVGKQFRPLNRSKFSLSSKKRKPDRLQSAVTSEV
jgi:NF-kappa-B inhibitor-interacting Ras-like protein